MSPMTDAEMTPVLLGMVGVFFALVLALGVAILLNRKDGK